MAEIMVFEKKYGKRKSWQARRRSNMNHSQKTEILTNKDVAIERLCANTVDLVKHARNIAVQQVNMLQLLVVKLLKGYLKK